MKKILLNKLKFNTVTDGRLLERWLSRPARQTYSSSRAKRLPTWAANTTPKHTESHVIADTRCDSWLVSRLHGQAHRDGRRSRHKLRSQPHGAPDSERQRRQVNRHSACTARQVRKMRREYAARHDRIVATLTTKFAEWRISSCLEQLRRAGAGGLVLDTEQSRLRTSDEGLRRLLGWFQRVKKGKRLCHQG